MIKFRTLFSEFKCLAVEGSFWGALKYFHFKHLCRKANIKIKTNRRTSLNKGIGIVGAGTYTASIHLPCLKILHQPIHAINSASGKSARALAHIYNIEKVHHKIQDLIADPRCDSLLISTPHYLHPDHILLAIDSGLYTYCEKPVAINASGLDMLIKKGLHHPSASKIMIGFNRRFAPAITCLRQEKWLKERSTPAVIHYKVNFGSRVENAMSDPKIGGGRIHGAACHYVDMISFLADSPIDTVSAVAVSGKDNKPDDNSFVVIMKLADGSIANLLFNSESLREYDAKEEICIYCDGHVARVVDYRKLYLDGKSHCFYRHSYGAKFAMQAFLRAKENNELVPIGLSDGIVATQVTLAIQESLNNGGIPVNVPRVVNAEKSKEPL